MDISDRTGKKIMGMSHGSMFSLSPSRWRYDAEVFLCSRGPAMHTGFADFLYTSLTDVGISVFWNKEELESGKEIDRQLIRAIEQSKISIPVISKEYASSKSCLLELDKMVKHTENKNLIIIPIFYYVKPKDVRDCTGPFADVRDCPGPSAGALVEHKKRHLTGPSAGALVEHKKRHLTGPSAGALVVLDGSFLNDWVSALREIGKLEGHHLHEENEGSHGEVVKQIVHQVLQKLRERKLIVPKQLVGVSPHTQDIRAKLTVDKPNWSASENGDSSVKVLGIFGIPGVGKTVLAKYVYNGLYHLFDACSFLGEIQAQIDHHGILYVQNNLISDLDKGTAKKFDSSEKALLHIRENFRTMKVLVLLDDVTNHEQLSALVGELDWLGPRSRVILTSQTQDVLINITGAETFVLEPMEQDEALKLFCKYAFGKNSPPEEYEKLSTDVVAATGRLPLALEVTGSSLFLVKSKKAWRETLTALEESPHKRVQAALEKSYANLDTNAREIFLDIACFFTEMDKRIPYYMWDDCNYSPSRSIQALHAKSLLKIREDKKLLMHEILRKFGREMVKNESRDEPFKRSRLWDPEEALHVLERGEGNGKVQALRLEFGDEPKENIIFQCDQFDGLQNLRFLKLDRADIQGNFGDRLPSLRWLDWRGWPEICDVQSLNLNLQNLVILDLSGSQVDKDWSGWELLKQARKLKVLKLTDCVQLTATPEFPASMELEILILEGCSKLAVIDLSFKNLKELVSLNMKGCSLLRELPDLGPMRGLEELLIDGTSISQINFQEDSMMMLKTLSARDCKNLTEISDKIGYLKSLTYLALDGTGIHILPDSIGSLEQLNTLSLTFCQRLTNLPKGIGNLKSLQHLDYIGTQIPRYRPSDKNLKLRKW